MPANRKGLNPDDYRRAMEQAGGVRSAAARLLGVRPETVAEVCARHGIPWRDGVRPEPPEPRPCDACGEAIPYTRTPSRYAQRRYCSPACANEGRRGQRGARAPNGGTVELPCDQCGTLVRRYASQVGGSVFCSNECRRRRIARPCAVCGSPVERWASFFAARPNVAVTCSRACSAKRRR
jgi:hypothetical protein